MDVQSLWLLAAGRRQKSVRTKCQHLNSPSLMFGIVQGIQHLARKRRQRCDSIGPARDDSLQKIGFITANLFQTK